MPNFRNLAKIAGKVITENSPTILTGIGVVGLVSTSVMAVRATMKAEEILREDAFENQANVFFRHDLGDRVRMTWKLYIPSAAVAGATIACIIGANTISSKRNAALISVYSLTETAFREYKDKVAETIGQNKEQKVRDDISQDTINRYPLSEHDVIITGNGDVLCFDSYTGRYFESNIEALRKAQNDINLECINQMYASQNDFYRKIGLASVETGENVGWNTENPLDLSFSASIIEESGKPCIVMNYHKSPVPNFYKIW